MLIENKTVSIVMPCYNSANYIEASIQSVIDQYYTDWELLIIDDASIG
jgi:teichuronic acid biosynthesis glycosyltransferase TuaG